MSDRHASARAGRRGTPRGSARAIAASSRRGPDRADRAGHRSGARPGAARSGRRGPATAASRRRRAAPADGLGAASGELQRLALEIDDPEAVGRDQDLAQVVVAVRADDLGRRRQRIEDGRAHRRSAAARSRSDTPGLARRDVEGRARCRGAPSPRRAPRRGSPRAARTPAGRDRRRARRAARRSACRGPRRPRSRTRR